MLTYKYLKSFLTKFLVSKEEYFQLDEFFSCFRRRLVCGYDNVTSLINVNELGPINKGCPYVPTRKKVQHQETNGVYNLI